MAYRLIIFCAVAALLFRCSPGERTRGSKWRIVTTTGMIKDAADRIAGDKADVEALMGPGVDPHLYKATQGDLQKLTGADVIFYNGLHLEGKMGDVLKKLSRQKAVVAIADELDTARLSRTAAFDNNYDPHIWFDVMLWKEAIRSIGSQLTSMDPANALYYESNLERYMGELDSLDREVRDVLSAIPEARRVLITAHDAFGYYGRAYHIEVRGLQGISTMSEYGLRDIADLVGFIIDRQIKAVFVETSVSDRAIKAVVQGCRSKGFEVAIGGNLYSDAMGEEGTPEGTYTGMVMANTIAIAEALQ